MNDATIEPHDVRGLARLLADAEAAFRDVEAAALLDLGLRPWMLRVLEHLARVGPRAPSQVAADLGVAQPTVSGWVQELTARGLVERAGVDGDGRRATLRLTDEGRELRATASDRVRRRQLRLASVLDPVTQAELVATLERIVGSARGQ
jgi:DNA-binding MarR family transcriptional regulator